MKYNIRAADFLPAFNAVLILVIQADCVKTSFRKICNGVIVCIKNSLLRAYKERSDCNHNFAVRACGI